jgi:hypothetical protein
MVSGQDFGDALVGAALGEAGARAGGAAAGAMGFGATGQQLGSLLGSALLQGGGSLDSNDIARIFGSMIGTGLVSTINTPATTNARPADQQAFLDANMSEPQTLESSYAYNRSQLSDIDSQIAFHEAAGNPVPQDLLDQRNTVQTNLNYTANDLRAEQFGQTTGGNEINRNFDTNTGQLTVAYDNGTTLTLAATGETLRATTFENNPESPNFGNQVTVVNENGRTGTLVTLPDGSSASSLVYDGNRHVTVQPDGVVTTRYLDGSQPTVAYNPNTETSTILNEAGKPVSIEGNDGKVLAMQYEGVLLPVETVELLGNTPTTAAPTSAAQANSLLQGLNSGRVNPTTVINDLKTHEARMHLEIGKNQNQIDLLQSQLNDPNANVGLIQGEIDNLTAQNNRIGGDLGIVRGTLNQATTTAAALDQISSASTFGEAFNSARTAGFREFNWNGKQYASVMASDIDRIAAGDINAIRALNLPPAQTDQLISNLKNQIFIDSTTVGSDGMSHFTRTGTLTLSANSSAALTQNVQAAVASNRPVYDSVGGGRGSVNPPLVGTPEFDQMQAALNPPTGGSAMSNFGQNILRIPAGLNALGTTIGGAVYEFVQANGGWTGAAGAVANRAGNYLNSVTQHTAVETGISGLKGVVVDFALSVGHAALVHTGGALQLAYDGTIGAALKLGETLVMDPSKVSDVQLGADVLGYAGALGVTLTAPALQTVGTAGASAAGTAQAGRAATSVVVEAAGGVSGYRSADNIHLPSGVVDANGRVILPGEFVNSIPPSNLTSNPALTYNPTTTGNNLNFELNDSNSGG